MSSELDRAIQAARAAGAAIRSFAGRVGDVRYKSPDQPVTEADHAANQAIRAVLRPDEADVGWISEEDVVRRRGSLSWIVDPLDGTRNFIEGRSGSAVCIALLDEGIPVLGVIHNPESGAVYHAERGRGAFLDGRPIRVRDASSNPLLVVSTSEIRRPEFRAALAPLVWEEVGSTALKMARVAEGSADIYLSAQTKGIWDVCAGYVLLQEAGGDAESLDGRFDWESAESVAGTVAWGGGTGPAARQLADRIRSICQTKPEEEA